VTNEELIEKQREEWKTVLELSGIPNAHIIGVLSLTEAIFMCLDSTDNEFIEQVLGFGDYIRGVATLSAVIAYMWSGVNVQ
jgi:hypothetical protein